MALLPDGRALVGQFNGIIFIVDTKLAPPWAKTTWGQMANIAKEGIDTVGERGLMVRMCMRMLLPPLTE